MTHPLYEAAYRAYRNTSHDPERRATAWCQGYDSDVTTLNTLGVPTDRLERLARAWLAAMARCASPMIVGPARFPVARMEKLNRFEMAHAERYASYMRDVQKPKREKLTPEDELAAAREKLEAAKAEHARLKAIPRDTREWYSLPYALRAIKDAQDRVAILEKRQALPAKEWKYQTPAGGLRIVQNPEAQRYQLFFDAKPDAATISALKGAGLKWAPSAGAWQRQITGNAQYAIARLVKQLTQEEPKQ